VLRFDCHPFSLTLGSHAAILAATDVDDEAKLSGEHDEGLLLSERNRSKMTWPLALLVACGMC